MEQYYDEILNIYEEHQNGMFSQIEFQRQLSNLDKWLKDELEEFKESEL
jgi:hypothetical protein